MGGSDPPAFIMLVNCADRYLYAAFGFGYVSRAALAAAAAAILSFSPE